MAEVIIIDDDDAVRFTLRAILERAGHAVRDARNGFEGLALCRERTADLIITDIIMPDKEGIETIREASRDFPDTKILAISGGGRLRDEDLLGMARRLGAHQVLAKPFLPADLLRTVEEIFSSA